MKTKNILFFVFIVFLLNGCVPSSPSVEHSTKKSQQNKAPFWITHPELLTPFEAVGKAKSSFAGMHMQQIEATNKAREILAQRIKSYIKVMEEQDLFANDEQLKKRYVSSTEVMTDVMLQYTYQADAYIDERDTLYVLIRIEHSPELDMIFNHLQQTQEKPLEPLHSSPFSIEPLLHRRCYPPAILQQIKTKAAMFNNYPVWFYRPSPKGSIGIAEKTSGATLASQKKAAITFAKSVMQRKTDLQMNSYYKLQKVLMHDEVSKDIHWNLSAKSSGTVHDVVISDIWMDPKQCDLYIWMIKD